MTQDPIANDPIPIDSIDFDKLVIYTSASRARRLGFRAPLGMVGHIKHLGDAEVIDGVPHQRMVIADLGGSGTVYCLPLSDPGLIEAAERAARSGTRVVAFGCFEQAPPPRGAPPDAGPALHLRVLHIRAGVGATELLGAAHEERAAADALIDRLRPVPNALRDHILRETHLLLGSETEGTSTRFRVCELLTVLQALSCGQVHEFVNPRISMLYLSDPGRGKKLLGLLGELLAPVSQTVQPTTLTPVGLSVRTEQKPAIGWTAHPGVFPLCDGGLVILEDHQRTPKNHQNAVLGLMNSTMEDGKIAPFKAAAATYSAQLGLQVNANRMSMITPELLTSRRFRGPLGRCKLAGLTLEGVSRFDTVVDLDADDDALAGAKRIATQLVEDLAPPAEGERRKRELKVLVARIKERFPMVRMGQVNPEIEELMDHAAMLMRSWAGNMKEAEQREFDVDSLLRRMANSVRKLIGAAARLSGRDEATVDDVRCAWRMLGYKLEFVRWLCGVTEDVRPLGEREWAVYEARYGFDERYMHILKYFSGQRVHIATLAQTLGVGPKTLRRELSVQGLVAERGFYTFPTQEEEILRRRQEALQQELAAEQAAAGEPAAPGVLSGLEEEGDGSPEEDKEEAPEFADGLSELGERYDEVYRQVDKLAEEDRDAVAQVVHEGITDGEAWPLMGPGLVALMEGDGLGFLPGVPRNEMIEVVYEPDARKRTGWLLMFAVGAFKWGVLPSIGYYLSRAMDREDLPDEVKQMMRAARRRMDYYATGKLEPLAA